MSKSMTMSEAKAIIADRGWEVVEHDKARPHIVWIRLGTRHLRRLDLNYHKVQRHSSAPSMHYENHLPSRAGGQGAFKYQTHGLSEDVIHDYADDKGREMWPDYVIKKDSSGNVVEEGPRPFKSKAERRAYEALTGLEQR